MNGLEDMLLGYCDGFNLDNPPPSGNRSAAYHHGFANGRDDRAHKPRDSAAALRAQAEKILNEPETLR